MTGVQTCALPIFPSHDKSTTPTTPTTTPTTPTTTGGSPFYKYELWNEFNTSIIRPRQNAAIFENVTPGKYTIRGSDANGCKNTADFSITVLESPKPIPAINSNSDLCYDTVNQSKIIIDVTSGTPPFTYSLNGAAPQTSNEFSSLFPGNYWVTIVDSNNCEAIIS